MFKHGSQKMWQQHVETPIRYYTETDATSSDRKCSYIQSQKGTTIYLKNNNPFGEYLTAVSYTIYNQIILLAIT